MVQQWTLTRQKGTGDLERLGVPKFTHELPLLLDWTGQVLLPRLQDEAHLGRHTEVRDAQQGDLLEKRVSCQLAFIPTLR